MAAQSYSETELTDIVTYLSVGIALLVGGIVSEVAMFVGAHVVTRWVVIPIVL